MKKVLLMLLAGVMVLAAKNAFADAVIAAQQADGRIVDSVDVIFAGYANKVVEHKNSVDFRLNAAGGIVPGGAGVGEWGGAIDGKHEDLGVIGVYINRPFTPNLYNAEPAMWGPTGGAAVWNTTQLVATGLLAFTGSPARGTAYVISTPNNKADIFWGKDSGDSNLGISLNYADANPAAFAGGNNTNTNNSTATVLSTVGTDSSRVLGANVGLGLKNAGSFSEVDIHAGYSMGTVSNTLTDSNTTAGAPIRKDTLADNGISTITLGALAQHDMDKDSNLRIFVDGVLNNFNTKQSVTTDGDNSGNIHDNAADVDYENTVNTNSLVVNLGLGCNHKVNDGAAVFSSSLLGTFNSGTAKSTESNQNGGAAVITTTNAGNEGDTTTIKLSWGASVDAKVASWLNVRAGIRKAIFNRVTTKTFNVPIAPATNVLTTTTTVDASTAVNFSTGFGIHFENWVLNTTVTAASLEAGIATPNVGGGLLYPGAGGEGLLLVAEADLGYAF